MHLETATIIGHAPMASISSDLPLAFRIVYEIMQNARMNSALLSYAADHPNLETVCAHKHDHCVGLFLA